MSKATDELGFDSVYGQSDEDNYELDDEEYATAQQDIENVGAILDRSNGPDSTTVHLGNIDSDLRNADWLKSRKDLTASGVDADAFTAANPDLPISQASK